MLTPNELEAISGWLDEPMRKLETQVMEDIIRRIRINGEITRAADWQMDRLTQLGILRSEIDEAIQNALSLDERDLAELYAGAVHAGYVRSQKLYKAAGLTSVPFAENLALQQLISSVAGQTENTMQNITRSLGFAVRDMSGRLYWSDLSRYYQQTLDNAVLGISTGLFDCNTVIKRTAAEMTNSGLRTIDYATGWKNRVDVAARRAVMTGLTQLTGVLNEQTAEELGTEYYEVSLHGGARPEHAEWQGRVWTRKQLETECGLGSVTGLCGANCRHNYYPFIPGISVRSYTDEYLAEFKAQQEEKHEFNGKKYNAYEAAQRQRALETTMRAQRQRIHLLEVGGADEQDIINARAQYRKTSGEYTRFSAAMGIPQQRERITVDGLGAVGVGKTKGAKEIPEIRPTKIGARRGAKVTDTERSELLYRGNNKLLTNGENGGIINSGNSLNFMPLSQASVVPTLRKDSEQWIRTLSSEEERAIKKYTKNSGDPKDDKFYARLNAMLRGERPRDSTLEYYSKLISDGIAKYPLNNDITCYRALSFDAYKGFNVGDIFIEPQFVSTSVTKSKALNMPFKITIHVPQGGRGAYIEKLSKYPNQREFLIDKNVPFRVLSKSDNHIELEMIV